MSKVQGPDEGDQRHIYHQQRKWKCPKCARVRMQKQKEKFDL